MHRSAITAEGGGAADARVPAMVLVQQPVLLSWSSLLHLKAALLSCSKIIKTLAAGMLNGRMPDAPSPRCAIACCDRVLINVQAALCKLGQQIAKVAVYLEAVAAAQAEAGLEPAGHRAWAWEMCEGELQCHRQWRDWPQQGAHSHSSSQLHNSNCDRCAERLPKPK
eukprot:16364-Heterococcus_DN1.PRE.1